MGHWQQVKPFDPAKAGTKPYYCLSNVRLGYGIPGKYDCAYDAWIGTQQHAEAPPAGVAVPVFFDWYGNVDGVYKNWGHVADALPDGRIWTDGRYYNSVQEVASQYLAKGKGKYLGWGESLNGVRVVAYVADPAPVPQQPQGGNEVANAEQVKQIYRAILFREGDDGGVKHYTGMDANTIISSMMGSAERKTVEAKYNAPPKEVVKEVVKEVKVPVEKIVEKVVEKPVEKIVEKVVTNEVVKKEVVDPTYYPSADLLRALLQKAVSWFNTKKG